MNVELVSRFLEGLGRVSVQAAVLVLLVLLVQWLFRRRLTPAWRCALWLLVVGRLVLPASLPTRISVFNLVPSTSKASLSPAGSADAPAIEHGQGTSSPLGEPFRTAPAPTVREAQERSAMPALAPEPAPIPRGPVIASPSSALRRPARISWPLLLLGFWAVGAGTLAAHVVITSVRLARRFRGLREVSDPEVLEVLEECRTRMQLRTRLRLVEGTDVCSPALHGVLRPRLLLPAGFTRSFSLTELHFVFLHELAHVKRRDVLMNWLVAVLQVVHWFNPFVWFGFARWRVDRELACDALALKTAGEGRNRDYGRTILRLLEGFAHPVAAPGLVGILEDKRQLQQRIGMIAAFVPRKRCSLLATALFIALAMVGLTDARMPQSKDKPAATAKPAVSPIFQAAAEAVSPLKPVADPAAASDTKAGSVLTRFTVVENETGTPLARARLSISYFFSGSRMERRELVADETGTAVIPAYEDKSSRGINVFVTPEGHVPKVISWPVRDDIPPTYTIRMTRATRVAGVVRDEAGQPVPGVKVNLARPGIRDNTERENIDFHPRATAVTTDADGRWSFHYVPKEFESVGVLMTHPDFAVTRHAVPVLKPESTNAVLVIERGVTVRGRVTGPDGAPVFGAEIKELHNYDYDVRSAQTTNDGSYSLKGIRQGEIKLVVQADGLAPQIRTLLGLNETGVTVQFDFTLAKGKTFRGRVVDKDGKPIAGAIAQTDWDNQGLRKVAWETKTDADGRFEWNAAPDEPLQFWFEAEGFGWKRGVLLRPSEADHEIVLERKEVQSPPVRVTGRAVDAATQQPLPSFKVSVGEVRHSELPPDYNAGTQGKDGEFRLTIDTPCFFPTYVILVEAEGYLPAKSQPQAVKDGNKTLDFALKKGSGPSGAIRLADGRPAAYAMVYYCTLRDGVYIDKPGETRQDVTRAAQVRADEKGRFSLPTQHDAHSIIVLHDEGFAEVKAESLQSSTNVVLAPWGRVEGQLLVGTKPAADETICVQTMHYRYGDGVRSFVPLSLWLLAQTDADGRFVIEKVPPGERKIARRLSFRKGKPGTIPETHAFPLNVKAGETTRVTIGGMGRPVVGRVVVKGYDEPIDWLRDVHWLALKLPDPSDRPRPQRDDFADEPPFFEALKEYSARHKAFWTSEEGRALERAYRRYVPVFSADGSFRVDDVPAGTYELTIKPTRGEDGSLGPSRLPGDGKPVGALTNGFTIPEMPNGRSDEPFDLGTLTLSVFKTLKVGQEAPLFETKTVAGEPLKLADYRGKFVLLDFWATWCGPCVAELPYLKAVWGMFGKEDRFAMIGLSLDGKTDAPRQFARTNGVEWTQGFLGDWAKTTVPGDYAVEAIPAIILIGPDGKIVAKDLRGPAIKAAVAKALQ